MLSPHVTRPTRLAGAIALLALLYFVAGRLSLLLAIPPGYATAVWPGAGIALAALLVYGRQLWPGVVLGSFLVNLSVAPDAASPLVLPQTAALAFAIGIGAGAQALLGSLLVRRFIRGDPGIFDLRNMGGLLLLGGPISCLVSASWGTGVLLAGGLIHPAELGFSWITWWIGDTIGVLICTPLALIWLAQPPTLWGAGAGGLSPPRSC